MTSLIRRTPAVLGRTAFDQIFDQFFDNPTAMVKRSTEGYPLTDIYQDEEENQIIEMALAGFSKEDLKVEVKENSITINCESNFDSERLSHRRIAKRSFSKSFVDYHNQLDLGGTTVTFENGMLRVTIPKPPEKKPSLIAIQ